METVTVNQAILLSLTCNYCGFIVEGMYDDGAILQAAKTNKDKETLIARMARLKSLFNQLGLDVKVTKYASMQGQIEVLILD